MPRPANKPLHQALELTNLSLLAKSDPLLRKSLLNEPFPLPGNADLKFGTMPPHTAIAGSSGTGKTLILKHLMSAVLGARREYGGLKFRAVVYDPKRELYPFLNGLGIPQQQIIVTHPFDSRTACWDLARDFVEPAQIEELAEMIVPSNKGAVADSTNDFFESTSRIIFQDVISGLAEAVPNNWDLRDIIEAVSKKRLLKAILQKTQNGANSWDAYLRPLQNDNQDKTALSIFASLATYARPFQSLAALWHRAEQRFSMESWVQTSGILLLGADPRRERTLQRINQLLMRRICQLVLGRGEERPVDLTWFFLDEVREAGKLHGLRQLMTEGRSKGARVVLGFQDIEGLYSLYGQHEAEEMVGLCANRIILHMDNPKTRKWASDCFGEEEFVNRTLGVSNTIGLKAGVTPTQSDSFQDAISLRPNVLPIEFHELPLGSIEQGVKGWFAIPGRRNKFFFPPEHAQEVAAVEKRSSQDAFVDRPTSHQEMHHWTSQELSTLFQIDVSKWKKNRKVKQRTPIKVGKL